MTTIENSARAAAVSKRRRRSLEVSQTAARMVIAASEANGETPDPRVVAVAEGKPAKR